MPAAAATAATAGNESQFKAKALVDAIAAELAQV